VRRRLPWLLVLVLAFPTGCKSEPDAWAYAWTRQAYGTSGGWFSPSGNGSYGNYGTTCGDTQLYLVALWLLPVIVDTVILPVTLTHDLRRTKAKQAHPAAGS
jgi:hypothetical protein